MFDSAAVGRRWRARNHTGNAESRYLSNRGKVWRLRRRHCPRSSSGRIFGDVRSKRPTAELVRLLKEQRHALAASCENYDKGNEWEAQRLATSFHSSPESRKHLARCLWTGVLATKP